jgi:hypothetical protein
MHLSEAFEITRRWRNFETSLQHFLILVAACFVSVFTSPTQSYEHSLETTATARWAENVASGYNQSMRSEIEPQSVSSFDNGTRLTAIGRIRTELRNKMGPDQLSLQSFSEVSRPQIIGNSTELGLREFYLETEWQNYHLTLGKQQVVWGEADGLKVLDIVNPQSFQEFILEDFDDSRIPTWMTNIETTLGNWDVQLLWIPDQTYSALPKPDAEFAITSPRLVPPAELLAALGTDVTIADTEKPGRILTDSDGGFRFSRFLNGWDVSINYLYHYDDLPVFEQVWDLSLPTPSVTVTPTYKRTHTFGGTASNAFGNWVVRSELGWSSDRYFISDNPLKNRGVAKGQELAYVLGLDWSGIENTFLSAQLFQSHFSEGGTERDHVESNATLLAQRLFWNDTLTIEMIWLSNLNNKDGLWSPKITYEWRDDLKTWFGVDLFYGDREGLFGQFDDHDQVVFGIEVGF